ncbi:acyltransferase [Sphingosinicellaceae bacterium]|nr:acyltransferase [Sphingosinicellaceae bacterium]
MSLPDWLLGRRLTPADLTADGNAFTALRWLLATSVMFSHGWDLTQYRAGLDPSVPIIGIPISGLAVFLFFSLSGFLVTGSLVKRGARDFALARALRLVPGLWVMLLVTTLGLGAVLGTLPFARFVTDPQTWLYVARNASLLVSDYKLPGVFENLPVAGVNGSLWTIPQEVRCYIVLGVLGAVGALRSRRWVALALIVLILIHLVVPLDLVPVLDRPRRLAVSFALGVVAYQWRDDLRWSWPLALAGVVAALALVRAPVPETVGLFGLQLSFAYVTGVAAFRAPAWLTAISRRLPDYSYGIYIYAFPAQQAAQALGYGTTPMANIGLGFLILLPFAAASWHLIEKPALGLKPRFTRVTGPKLSDNFTLDQTGPSGSVKKTVA